MMSKIKCTGGRHVRVVNKDGSWPDACQCGKHVYRPKPEPLPPLGVKVSEKIQTKERLG